MLGDLEGLGDFDDEDIADISCDMLGDQSSLTKEQKLTQRMQACPILGS
jgi:hypothetical protein